MTENEEILRIAAKGEGLTASGRHIAFAAPGDTVRPDDEVIPGPHHAQPPCRHFGTCGGCQLQHVDEEELARFVYDRVAFVTASQGIVPGRIAEAAMSPPRSRRRGSLRGINGGGGRAMIGFNAAGSHRVVDMRECHVLHPDLFGAVENIRRYFNKIKGKFAIGVEVALVDQGVDALITGFAPEGLEQTEDLLDWCREHPVARLTLDQGYGPEAFWEPEPVTVTLSGVAVSYPPGGFLQATDHGEATLTAAAREWLGECTNVVDLFAGLGTFAFALADPARVTAIEGNRAAMLACRAAAGAARRPVETQHRDLFRNPVRAEELAGYDGIVLDPPRAGARMQVEQIAASPVARVAYISCNPSSWARDAAMLAASGYDLVDLRPVGQFRWSTHVELASLFVKNG